MAEYPCAMARYSGSLTRHSQEYVMTDATKLATHRAAQLKTPSPLSKEAIANLSAELNALLADTFALYLKTKNYHWHMSGPYFRDYHLLLDEQADQIFCHDRSGGRTRTQAGGHHLAFHWAYRAPATLAG